MPRLAGDIIVVVVATRLVLNASLPALAVALGLPLTPWSNNFHFAANGRKERIKFYEPQATERQQRVRERLPEWQQRLPRQKFVCAFVLAIKSPVPFKPHHTPSAHLLVHTYRTPERMQLIWEVGAVLGTLEWSWRFIGGFAS